MSDTQLDKLGKSGLSKVWENFLKALKTQIGEVDKTKGTLQEQIDNLELKSGQVSNFSDDPDEIKMAGVADAGESDKAARADHVHPDNKKCCSQEDYDGYEDTKLIDGIYYFIVNDGIIEKIILNGVEATFKGGGEIGGGASTPSGPISGDEVMYDEETSVKEKIDEVNNSLDAIGKYELIDTVTRTGLWNGTESSKLCSHDLSKYRYIVCALNNSGVKWTVLMMPTKCIRDGFGCFRAPWDYNGTIWGAISYTSDTNYTLQLGAGSAATISTSVTLSVYGCY